MPVVVAPTRSPILAVALLAAIVAACASPYTEPSIRGPAIKEADIEFFTVGRTTREQVIESLGTPLVVMDYARLMAYRGETLTQIVQTWVPTKSGGFVTSYSVSIPTYVFIEFGPESRVRRHEQVVEAPFKPLRKQLRTWALNPPPAAAASG